MNYEDKINVLPYIFGIFILSSYTFILSYRSKWLAILIASCFFIMIIYKTNLKFSIIMLIFFCVPIINNIYYNDIDVLGDEDIRIISINSYGAIGEVQGRKAYLSGNIKGMNLGDKVTLSGDFNKNLNREKGIIGEYSVKNFKKLDIDLKGKIYKLRESIFDSLKEKLGYRRAAIVTSISFGYTEFLDREDKENMKSLGILHAISVSGLHMVLVYSILKKIFGERISPFISIVYVIFTGAALSTVRAYIMMICMSLATPLKRNYNPLAGLSLSGILIMLYKPYSVFEIGFQLSFLATLGIILFNKRINKKLYKIPKTIREGVSICISAQIFTFPVLVGCFKEFSLGFLLGNLILLPLINIVVILGNLLALVIKSELIFNYIAFLTYYVTMFIDIATEWLLNITPKTIYLNETINIGYIIMLITVYFYKKGYKKIIYLPMSMIMYFYIFIYSPFPKIEYFKDGAISLSYKGDRAVVALKKGVNLEKFKSITLSQKVYKDFDNIKINSEFRMIKYNNNIMLNGRDKNYLLKVSKGKNSTDYDIIDFKEGSYSKIILFRNKVLVLD